MDNYDAAMQIAEVLDSMFQLKDRYLYFSQDEAQAQAWRAIEKLDALYQQLWREDKRIPARSWFSYGDTRVWAE